MPSLEDTLTWRGQTLRGRDGDKIGSIEEIYLDAETNEPEWALVNTGLFGSKHSFVPLRDATGDSEGVTTPFDKSTVKDAPKMDPDGRLSQDEEAELYRHYGLEYSETHSDSGLAEGSAAGAGAGTYRDDDTTAGTYRDDDDVRTTSGAGTTTGQRGGPGEDVSGPNTDDAMTRSEEELRVGTTEREAGRARLRKYVVTDQVETTVPVQREEVRVEREPITDANVDEATSGPDLSEEEHEVTLRSEEAVAEKRVVPKERVRLAKDTVTDEQQVTERVRKERIDVDDPTRRP